jgi:mRNA-degrading endonuclease RelE of RelBE toxin-antitoxin system
MQPSGKKHVDNWQIEYKQIVLKKDIPAISFPDQKRIEKAIENKLLLHPFLFSKSLSGFASEFYKFRAGDYRVVWYEDKGKIVVVIISHRKDIYEKLKKRIDG